jgi:hypothetical protein
MRTEQNSVVWVAVVEETVAATHKAIAQANGDYWVCSKCDREFANYPKCGCGAQHYEYCER